MRTYTLTTHVIDRLTFDRPLFSVDTLQAKVLELAPVVEKFADGKTHQVAVILAEYDKPMYMGKSYGDRLVLAFDVKRKTVCTVFLRNKSQGCPKMAQVLITQSGNVVAK